MNSPARPRDPVRTMRARVRATALVVAMLATYGVVAGEPDRAALYWTVLAAGLALVAFGWLGKLAFAERQPWWTTYPFMVVGVGLMSWFVVAAAPGPVELWLPLWGLQAVSAAYSFPRPGQIGAYVLGVGSMVAVLGLRGADLAAIVLDVGLYLLLAHVTENLSGRLREVVDRQRTARIRAEDRHRLLVALARMNHLDVTRLAGETVGALATLGYEMSSFGLLDEEHELLHPIATTGFEDDRFATEPVRVGDGLAGQAITNRQTMFVEDYQTWDRRLEGRQEVRGGVAVPIIVDGRVRGVLQGARRTPGIPDAAAVEVIEVLAAQAARLLRNAEQFQQERRTGDRLRELDRLKGDFIASVSHELRTPLTVLQGAGQTLAERSSDLTPDQRAMLIDRLNANADRLDRMIAALLQMSNLEAGGVQVQAETVALDSLVARVAASFDQLRDAHRLDVDLSGVRVEADPALLELVFASLVGNAVKHTPVGTCVRISADVRGSHVEVEVSDDGPGIAPEERPYILDQFFRGGPSTRRSSSGLGLGLTVADRVLVQHGSRLEVLEGGGGARFRFRLPVADPAGDDQGG